MRKRFNPKPRTQTLVVQRGVIQTPGAFTNTTTFASTVIEPSVLIPS